MVDTKVMLCDTCQKPILGDVAEAVFLQGKTEPLVFCSVACFSSIKTAAENGEIDLNQVYKQSFNRDREVGNA